MLTLLILLSSVASAEVGTAVPDEEVYASRLICEQVERALAHHQELLRECSESVAYCSETSAINIEHEIDKDNNDLQNCIKE